LPVADLTAAWVLEAADLLSLAGMEAGRLPVFKQPGGEDGAAPVLSRLERIHGRTGASTDLLCAFAPLEVLVFEAGGGAAGGGPAGERVVVREPDGARRWTEALKLNGGPLRPDAPWVWANVDLNIGAAVFGTPAERGGA